MKQNKAYIEQAIAKLVIFIQQCGLDRPYKVNISVNIITFFYYKYHNYTFCKRSSLTVENKNNDCEVWSLRNFFSFFIYEKYIYWSLETITIILHNNNNNNTNNNNKNNIINI